MGTIDPAGKTVSALFLFGADRTTLAPTITVSPDASVSPASGAAQDFTNPVVYTVTAEDGTAVQWTVTAVAALTSVSDLGDYFSDATETGADADNAIPLTVILDLADSGGNGWTDLLSAIGTKHVHLDLTHCTMSGTEFDPGAGTTGVDKIVSITLPDTATSIKAGTSSNPAFKNFSALKSVTGGAVTGIGDFAFFDCNFLETVNLPAATGIGEAAFAYCTSLIAVDLPAATSIGDMAFYYCTSLTTISLPVSLTSIEGNPFARCTGLTISIAAANPRYMVESGNKLLTTDGTTLVCWPAASGPVDLSGITTISNYAFSGCTGLTSVSLPAVTNIGPYAFTYTGMGDLTVTLGDTPPELGWRMFFVVSDESGDKSVTVMVPNNEAWSGLIGGSYNDTTGNWGNAFRGGGWNGTSMFSSTAVNENINLTIKAQEETL
jgi:hypothetical protein